MRIIGTIVCNSIIDLLFSMTTSDYNLCFWDTKGRLRMDQGPTKQHHLSNIESVKRLI